MLESSAMEESREVFKRWLLTCKYLVIIAELYGEGENEIWERWLPNLYMYPVDARPLYDAGEEVRKRCSHTPYLSQLLMQENSVTEDMREVWDRWLLTLHLDDTGDLYCGEEGGGMRKMVAHTIHVPCWYQRALWWKRRVRHNKADCPLYPRILLMLGSSRMEERSNVWSRWLPTLYMHHVDAAERKGRGVEQMVAPTTQIPYWCRRALWWRRGSRGWLGT